MADIQGVQKEVKAVPKAHVDTKNEVAEKLEKGFRFVDIPSVDLYNYKFEGISINHDTYKPGKHLVPSDVADSLEERLAVWQKANVRLMRPQADIDALKQLGQVQG